MSEDETKVQLETGSIPHGTVVQSVNDADVDAATDWERVALEQAQRHLAVAVDQAENMRRMLHAAEAEVRELRALTETLRARVASKEIPPQDIRVTFTDEAGVTDQIVAQVKRTNEVQPPKRRQPVGSSTMRIVFVLMVSENGLSDDDLLIRFAEAGWTKKHSKAAIQQAVRRSQGYGYVYRDGFELLHATPAGIKVLERAALEEDNKTLLHVVRANRVGNQVDPKLLAPEAVSRMLRDRHAAAEAKRKRDEMDPLL